LGSEFGQMGGKRFGHSDYKDGMFGMQSSLSVSIENNRLV
jgi:hypothetical protein